MGVFATVELEKGVDLPHFPEQLDPQEYWWQSKQGLDVYSGPYKITEDGRLLRKEQSRREKTDEEKQAEAEKWGYDSWGEYCQAYDEMDPDETDSYLFPDEIDYDVDDDDLDEKPPTFYPDEKVLDETWWADQNFHGTFEFHANVRKNPIEHEEIDGIGEKVSEYEYTLFFEYEARFTKGELDQIVLTGGRYSDDLDEFIEEVEDFEDEFSQ